MNNIKVRHHKQSTRWGLQLNFCSKSSG